MLNVAMNQLFQGDGGLHADSDRCGSLLFRYLRENADQVLIEADPKSQELRPGRMAIPLHADPIVGR